MKTNLLSMIIITTTFSTLQINAMNYEGEQLLAAFMPQQKYQSVQKSDKNQQTTISQALISTQNLKFITTPVNYETLEKEEYTVIQLDPVRTNLTEQLHNNYPNGTSITETPQQNNTPVTNKFEKENIIRIGCCRCTKTTALKMTLAVGCFTTLLAGLITFICLQHN